MSDYRGRLNLVLVFADNEARTAALLSEVATRYRDFKNWDAEILVVVQLAPEQAAQMTNRLKLPFPLLLDEDGRTHRDFGASNSQGQPATAVYITDRYGEVFGLYRTGEGQPIPGAEEILNWVEFVGSQCPECEPPEWPL